MINTPTITRIHRVPGSTKIKVEYSDKHGMSYPSLKELRDDVREWVSDFRNLRMLALAVALDRLRGGDERTIANFNVSIDSDRA